MLDTLAVPTWQSRVGAAPLAQPQALGFPTSDVLEPLAAYVGGLVGFDGDAERHYVLPGVTSPGLHRVRTTDAYRVHVTGGTLAVQVTQARPYVAPTEWTMADQQGLLWDDDPIPAEDAPARVIAEWSRRSRARMVRALAEIDFDGWRGGPFAMVTLTLPGEWRSVAPTGRAFKDALRRFQKRYVRATGLLWQVAWKMEFQRRGAPHFHLLMKPPALVAGERFEDWLSRTWADCVGATGDEYERHVAAGTNVDFGYRTTDPKRVAVYFLKHSSKTQDSKEYQHIVPAAWRVNGSGPGRFWGVAGLDRPRVSIELEAHMFYKLRREMRKLHRSLRAKTALDRRRAVLAQMVGETWRRPTLEDLSGFGLRHDRLLRSAKGGGWVVLNDAPTVAYRMAEWLAASVAVAVGPDVGKP